MTKELAEAILASRVILSPDQYEAARKAAGR